MERLKEATSDALRPMQHWSGACIDAGDAAKTRQRR
jgi:hypothetical protein